MLFRLAAVVSAVSCERCVVVSVLCRGPVVVVYASYFSYPLSGYRTAFIVVTVHCTHFVEYVYSSLPLSQLAVLVCSLIFGR
jgi:intracellular septation protein A